MKSLSVIIFLLLFSACSPKQLEYTASDAKHLDLIVSLLDKRNIPYQIENGRIYYSESQTNQMEEVLLAVRKTTSLKFEQENVREYFYSQLEQREIEYLRAKAGSDGEVIFWPDNQSVTDEVLLKTIEYRFEQDIKNGKFSNECNLTSQTTPAAGTHECARF